MEGKQIIKKKLRIRSLLSEKRKRGLNAATEARKEEAFRQGGVLLVIKWSTEKTGKKKGGVVTLGPGVYQRGGGGKRG